ncbi:MAG: dynamin family protein [Paenibacillaceae bacterium]|nr:dynamin family protein [Paenibacillaceae bacterium]
MSVQTMDHIVQTMTEAGDERNAGKLHQVLRKREGGLLQIAFCGHFSAGKSSLINKLCGHPLLPSSPIPTSANVVTISGGPPSARIVRESGKTETVDPDQLEEYCKDGQSIESIAITYPIPLLGDAAALLDTPGIDSTDGAHRLATESALHLADVVFYVMDYNHVQSEHNFAFTKRLQDWGKPLYLIVNQIDKHNDREIGFDAFRESVEQSFANWHIRPEGILYTSVRKPEHPFDEWGKLLWLLKQLMRVGDSLRAWSVDRSVRQLIEDHARTVQERGDAEKERLREAAAPTPAPEEAQPAAGEAGAEESVEAASAGVEAEPPATRRDRLAGERERLAQRLQEARQRGDTLAAAWKRDAGGIIDNANITPAATRDAAHHYLQSRKPGFKVGLFGRAAQTAKEIETRLAAFHADFAEGVRAQLEWHLTDFVRKAVESVGLPTPNYQALIDSVRIEVSADWLAGEVSPGAGFNGEYTLNYMKQVAADVKANARRAMWSAIESLAAEVEAAGGGEAERLAAQLAALDGRLAAAERLAAMAEQERRYEQALLQSAAAFAAEPPSLPSLGGYAAPAAIAVIDGDAPSHIDEAQP